MPRRTEPSPYDTQVGARIRALRQERNLSIAELAAAASVSPGHLTNIERGLGAITISTAGRLARALELPALFLVVFPDQDERDRVVDAVRKMPRGDVRRFKRDLTQRLANLKKLATN
jgi:transcriptional regulator with XRE-family HTH domain